LLVLIANHHLIFLGQALYVEPQVVLIHPNHADNTQLKQDDDAAFSSRLGRVQEESEEEGELEEPINNRERSGLFSHIVKKSPKESSSGLTIPLLKWPSKKPEAPFYTKFWDNRHALRRHAPKKYKKTKYKIYRNRLEPGYFVDLKERVLDGLGFIPEFKKFKNKNKGWQEYTNGKYVFKGITMHHGLYTSVL